MNGPAVSVENITKLYKLYDKPSDRVKEALNPFTSQKYHREFFALKDVSFEVNRGETLGVVGKNGSGKSTLLKILTGVLTPTSGRVVTDGRISSLLELGAGFNFELTGLENIFLFGTINGFSKEEMNQRLEQIIEFADIGPFINQPVKMYSSGMFVRLAFAAAINIDPEILIVDEALSVGDMKFQKKCLERIDQFREAGKTILFCSHDLHAVGELCSRVIWLKDGEVAQIGEPGPVISSYVSMMTEAGTKETVVDSAHKNPNHYIKNSEEVNILSVKAYDSKGIEKDVFFTGEDIHFNVKYQAFSGINGPNYSVIIFRKDKIPVGISKTNFDKSIAPRGFIKGEASFEVILKNIQLNAGHYLLSIAIWDKAKKIIFAENRTFEFEVKSLKIVFGPTEEKCVFFPETEWKY